VSRLVFLKLGGSLITEKHTPSTARLEVIARLGQEIRAARQGDPNLRLVLGHGSGSFGHSAASRHGTRQGVTTPEGWYGFNEVWLQARKLNSLVIDGLAQAGNFPVSFPVSAAAITTDGEVASWELTPLQSALDNGLLPVVYGDVVFDTARGGTILSTEDIFKHLARKLRPHQILLAGLEPGVWADYPKCSELVGEITPDSFETILPSLSGSDAADVTGGMRSKVEEMLELVNEMPGLEVFIFSGEENKVVESALRGESQGTKIIAHS
jgi:isopentenyl phosphate kinase